MNITLRATARYPATARCISRPTGQGAFCKAAETRASSGRGRSGPPGYTELRSSITQFKILSVRQTMWWRALAAIFGALPATALGVMAFAALIAGSQGFAADTFLAALFFVWGALGVSGAVGLWLTILEQTPRLAGSLT